MSRVASIPGGTGRPKLVAMTSTTPALGTRDPFLYVRRLASEDILPAAQLFGRVMAANPLPGAVYRGDERRRAAAHTTIVRALLAHAPRLSLEGVELGGRLVGALASTPSNGCRLSGERTARLAAAALGLGPATALRVLRWSRAWSAHDLEEPHVHLASVAVDSGLRRRGIGSLLMLRHVAALDSIGAVGYLQTDRPGAVDFFAGFGFLPVEKADVLGVPCWFLRRPPTQGHG